MDRSVLNACPGISLSRASLLPHALALPCGYGWQIRLLLMTRQISEWQMAMQSNTPCLQLPAAAEFPDCRRRCCDISRATRFRS